MYGVLVTIRKPPFAEVQTAVGKRKKNTFCGMRVSVPLLKFCEKLLPHTNFTEIGQLAELWPRTIFKMAAVCHLEFLEVQYWVL